jgi:hypothetical protein
MTKKAAALKSINIGEISIKNDCGCVAKVRRNLIACKTRKGTFQTFAFAKFFWKLFSILKLVDKNTSTSPEFLSSDHIP